MNEIVNQLRECTLKAYEARPTFLREHYGIEQVVLAGGYGYRQVMELVQNGADAVLEECEQRTLRIGAEQSRWQVVCREVAITDERARADATHIHARDKVPLAWAIPLDGKREEAGRFWAFFPTHTPTYLPGILNAPWKLNSDRNAIIGGEWNSALMREAARLIAGHAASAFHAPRPGAAFGRLPASTRTQG